MDYKLSVGFNGNLELLDKMFEDKNNKIGTLYTGGFLREVSSGRFQFSDDEKKLEKLAQSVHDKGAEIAITLNSPCNVPPLTEKEWWNRVKEYLKTLQKIGIDTAIIATSLIIRLSTEYTDKEVV